MAGKREGLNRSVPNWLNSFLDLEGAQKIEQAVTRAELMTEAEIVPMIVRSSSSTSSVLPRLFMFFLLLSLVAAPYLEHHLPLPYASHALAILLLASAVFALILSCFSAVQRFLIPKTDQITDVEHRAVYEYHQKKIGRTRHDTGVLIFVSLMEHRAVILAEGEIMDRVEKELWQNAIGKLLAQIKEGNISQGFVEAIDMCTQRLSEVAPAKPDNPNQISNHLIIEE